MASLISLLSLSLSLFIFNSSSLFNLFPSSSLWHHPILLFFQLCRGLSPSLSSLGGSIFFPTVSLLGCVPFFCFFVPTCITALHLLHKIIGGLGFSLTVRRFARSLPCRISSLVLSSTPCLCVFPLHLLAFLSIAPSNLQNLVLSVV